MLTLVRLRQLWADDAAEKPEQKAGSSQESIVRFRKWSRTPLLWKSFPQFCQTCASTIPSHHVCPLHLVLCRRLGRGGCGHKTHPTGDRTTHILRVSQKNWNHLQRNQCRRRKRITSCCHQATNQSCSTRKASRGERAYSQTPKAKCA